MDENDQELMRGLGLVCLAVTAVGSLAFVMQWWVLLGVLAILGFACAVCGVVAWWLTRDA